MRILVTGATGLIGGAVAAGLVEAGHRVVGTARRAPRGPAAVEWVRFDIAAATRAEDWLPHLKGIDAVVNCAGVLQDGPDDSTAGVHVAGAGALFAACEQRGVRRVVQISAIGADPHAPTAFARSKAEGDAALMARDLDWIVLRPSVVLGASAYGGSALFRGLAALPVLPVVADAGPLQVVQLDDIVATVVFFVRREAPARFALDIVGPERLSFSALIAHYRRWLGWRAARTVTVPGWAAALVFRLGDLAGWLGWRAPLRTTAQREIARGSVGDPTRWTKLTGIAPRSLAAALARRPASVQERWFAGIYLLKPLILGGLALFWIATGLLTLGPAYDGAAAIMGAAGAGAIGGPAVVAGALLDIAIGAAIAWRRSSRHGLRAGLAVSVFYLLAATALLPALWADPLGPLVKVVPVMLLTAVALAILEDR